MRDIKGLTRARTWKQADDDFVASPVNWFDVLVRHFFLSSPLSLLRQHQHDDDVADFYLIIPIFAAIH
jgi:hypothetical protein